MATFGYARISTKEQTAENQRLEIERAGYSIDYWYADTITGKTCATQRPQFGVMLGQIRRGETLVVSKLDRLGRDAQDIMATIRMLARSEIAVVVLQLGNLDLGSPAGKLMLSMLAAVAELERDLLVERTQAGLARAKSEGKTLGRPLKTNNVQRTDILRKYNEGDSVSSLARSYSVSRASILSIVKGGLTIDTR